MSFYMRDRPQYTKVGFTGTASGMTLEQQQKVQELLIDFGTLEVHHGDCVGADAEFHEMTEGTYRVIHPPINEKARAFCKDADAILRPKEYLERNKDIVDATNVLIATPKTAEEPKSLRGQGTWWTINYALRNRRPTYIIAPDGSLL